MIRICTQKTLTCALALSIVFLSLTASAQKYKSVSDTTALNKAYGKISLEMSKLNTRLLEAKNKTAGYQQKTSSTASDAVMPVASTNSAPRKAGYRCNPAAGQKPSAPSPAIARPATMPFL